MTQTTKTAFTATNPYQKGKKAPQSYYSILVLSLCASFLFYKYIIQNFPSVMSHQLMTDFNLHGVGLGMLSGGYFWTYLITPLFVGAIIDRYGARWVSTLAILSCAVGVFWFAQIKELNMAIATRAIMGFGVSFATIAYMKLAANWFSPKKYPLLIGLVVTAAMAGAVFGQMPLAWLVKQVGWRNSLSNIGIAGFVLALLFVLIVREKPKQLERTEGNSEVPVSLADIAQIFRSRQNWLLFLYNGLAFSPIVIFGGLWGNPFLQAAYKMDAVKASSLISLIFIGLGLGGPVFALISERLNLRKKLMVYTTLISTLSITLVLYCHPMPTWLLASLLFVFGFSLGAFSLVFVIGKEINPLKLAGTAIAMINASDALLDAITEPAVGKLLDVLDPQISLAGIHAFSIHSYHLALAILPLYQLVSVLLLFWVKKD